MKPEKVHLKTFSLNSDLDIFLANFLFFCFFKKNKKCDCAPATKTAGSKRFLRGAPFYFHFGTFWK